MERRHARYSMVREFDYCLAWAQAHLKKVGCLARSTCGVWVLTAEGRAIMDVDEPMGVLEVQMWDMPVGSICA